MIAMPPKDAKSLDDYREYYTELCKLTSRPVFIQTSVGAPDIEPTIDLIVRAQRKVSELRLRQRGVRKHARADASPGPASSRRREAHLRRKPSTRVDV